MKPLPENLNVHTNKITLNNIEVENQIKLTKIIYLILFFGMLLLFVIIIILIESSKAEFENEFDKVFIVIIPFFGLLTMLITKLIYNKLTTVFTTGNEILQKVNRYRTAKIISWAIVEIACLLILVASIITSNYLYVVVVIFLFGYIFMLKPSKGSLIRDMRLSPDERDIIL